MHLEHTIISCRRLIIFPLVLASFTFLAVVANPTARAQSCPALNFQWQADIGSVCSLMVMTMIHDRNNLPYLYVANKEGGLKVYDIANVAAPSLVATVPNTLFGSLDVMSLSQDSNFLYLALGNSFTNPEPGGLAIVDVTNPAMPSLTDYYVVPGSNSGGGIVKVEGKYAYLGAMQSGLVVLDVMNKTNIKFVSQFVPSIAFPPVPNPDPLKYNARGMEVKNGIVYLCYDAGGIRIVNCTNPALPVETGRWCNPAMYTPFDHPKAYNNCILDDTLLYVAVDYAGLEVLNVTDTANITMTGWWNPYNAPNANWFASPGHTNEMAYEKDCKRLYLSSGKSDLHVIDVSNPALPDSCNYYGGTGNNIGTWGVGLWQNQLYLSYICALIPFVSNWTGVKILTFSACPTGTESAVPGPGFSIYPNPFSGNVIVETSKPLRDAALIVRDGPGRIVIRLENMKGLSLVVPGSFLLPGIYWIELFENGSSSGTQMLLKLPR